MQVEGKLFGWFETGLEGVVWALEQEGVLATTVYSLLRKATTL